MENSGVKKTLEMRADVHMNLLLSLPALIHGVVGVVETTNDTNIDA
jgi:hypothetical protein